VLAAAQAPVAAVAPVASFIARHGRTIRKVVIATAIGTGVAAACAGAVVAASAIGAVACGSSIVTGGYAAYRNATD
jgi:choline-glycine betaine transporter